jgi:CDP-4-dehydro-6-deoxyglucose reductase
MAYQVRIQHPRQTFEVEPGESILEAALRNEIALAHDCMNGFCGSCRIKLAEGMVDYLEQPAALTPEDERAGYALACQARPTSNLIIDTVDTTTFDTEPSRYLALVQEVRSISDSVTHLSLKIPTVESLVYRPGQYMNIILPDGRVRSFSMASAPNCNLIDFHVRRNIGGAFTDNFLRGLKAGEPLDIEFPFGSFFFHSEDYRPIIMVATGTGLAPIKSMLEALVDDPDCPPVILYWGMRTELEFYLEHEIRRIGKHLDDFRYVAVASRPGATWVGKRGYVQQAVASDFDDLGEFSIYLCGSPRMILEAKETFLARGASIDYIYAEAFSVRLDDRRESNPQDHASS